MMIRVDTGDVLGSLISKLQGESDFVHGGLAIGAGQMVEVNGGLGVSRKYGQRMTANIYRTRLHKENKRVKYVVYRPVNEDLGLNVAKEAVDFATEGEQAAWGALGYNLKAGIQSLDVYKGRFGDKSAEKKNRNVFLNQNESVVSMARREGKSFFCTQWMVWMYLMVSKQTKTFYNFNMAPKDALPGRLVAALDRSSDFTYKGCILPG